MVKREKLFNEKLEEEGFNPTLGCDLSEISTLYKGYSLPSFHLMVSFVLIVDRVRNE